MGLEGDKAISRWRELMGPTDSKKAPARHHPCELRKQHRAHAAYTAATARTRLALNSAGSSPDRTWANPYPAN